jgi:hypothetical protein
MRPNTKVRSRVWTYIYALAVHIIIGDSSTPTLFEYDKYAIAMNRTV